MFTQIPFLLRMQQWLIEDFELANPWLHPMWFLEDIWLLSTWFAEDYLFCSPVFQASLWIFLAYAAIRVRRSYLGYIALGRGRQPSNVIGWLKNTFLEFLLLRVFRINIFSKPYISPYMLPYIGRLNLHEREYPRPKIIGIGPLAQKTDGNPHVIELAMQAFRKCCEARPDLWEIHTSLQSGLPTLRRILPAALTVDTLDSMREWGDTVAELHPDGSITVFLHPSDAAEVVRKKWGERNPLAVMHEVWLWRFIYHEVFRDATPLHHGSCILYAPLDEDEELIAHDIFVAALWWKEQFPTELSI